MDVAAMARRCPASRPLGVARLVRHRFFISGDGFASVARDPRRNVWGLLWDLAFADVPALDRYEELSTGLYAKVVQPVLTGQGSRRAMLYVGRSTAPGTPKPSYMEGIVFRRQSRRAACGIPARTRNLASECAIIGRPGPEACCPAPLVRADIRPPAPASSLTRSLMRPRTAIATRRLFRPRHPPQKV
jgi:hypothetical protein